MKSPASTSHFQDNKLEDHNNHHHYCLKKDRFINYNGCNLSPLLSFCLLLTTLITFFLLYSPNPLEITTRHDSPFNLLTINSQKEEKEESYCDLFKGHWVPDIEGPRYTNSSCRTIPASKNCVLNGRKDRDFLNWRWKPDRCDLPRFNSRAFLRLVRGKRLAFVGDSVARNHMESLLCLLSQEEIPIDVYKDSEDRNRIWYFTNNDFTLSILWTKFLVEGEERMINGSASAMYDLYLDKIDRNWVKDLPVMDYAIISTAHWFFRPLFLHKGDNLIGCVYCNEPNVTKLDVIDAIGLTLRAGLGYINRCKKCKKNMVTLVRTFSPSHFENGTWNTGGSCHRMSPYTESEIDIVQGSAWKLRSVQVDEIERARKGGEKKGRKFGMLDITRAMLMRGDGHPGEFWGNKWMKGYNDCVHWCLPGPVDVWNDFLIAILSRKTGFVS